MDLSMYDLEKLYKRYLLYRLKRLVFPLVVVFTLLSVGVYHYFDKDTLKIEKSTTKSLAQIKQKESKPVVHTKKTAEVKEQKEVLKEFKNRYYKFFTLALKEKDIAKLKQVQKHYASLGLSCEIEHQNNLVHLVCGVTDDYKKAKKTKALLQKHRIAYYLVVREPSEIDSKQVEQKVKKSLVPEVVKVPLKKVEEKKEKKEIFLSHTNADNAKLEKIYAEHKNYATAIKLAKNYYEKGDYKQSLHWAKEANHLDRKKEQSWIIYAKSLYALGKKKQAIEMLTLYKRFASSATIENLLRKWNNDK
jgi:tetratricopeptide (TPR) repeat protein